ncbi:MAG: pyridoxal phosphate-dependent aminotransferase [Rickettsiales bacterium]|nr:pyridoxal phosphate-dependent aminotransferase [Rickettsiales bacterium]
MKQVAKFISEIKPSATLALAAKAKTLKAQGVDVISLTVGEPDFDTPENIKAAAIEAIKSGKTKYTPVDGIVELKKAIQSKYNTRINDLKLDNIIVSVGAKQSLYNCFMVTVELDDEVIIPAPYWVSYPDMVMLARGKPVIVNTTEEEFFKLTASKLKAVITSRTRWVILNSPSNPTGMKYSKQELKDIAEVIKSYPHVGIISDDIYEDINFEGEIFSLIDVAPELVDRILVINGVSKSYAMTGWRVGYAIGHKDIIKAMEIIQSQSTSNPCSISQYAALEALTGDQSFLKTLKNTFKERCDIALEKIQKINELSCVSPDGAFYLFPSCSKFFNKKMPDGNLIKDDNDFCDYLLNDAKVVVVPGSAFGFNGYFRLSYAVSVDTIVEAINRIDNSCKKLI